MTTTRVTGWINVTRYDPQPYEEQTADATLSAVLVHQRYSGGLVGQGIARFLMVQLPDSTAHFTGIEHFTGTLDGRTGSFLMRNTGVLKDNAVTSEWAILPGSATGEFVGLTGTGGTNPSGYFLDFAFE